MNLRRLPYLAESNRNKWSVQIEIDDWAETGFRFTADVTGSPAAEVEAQRPPRLEVRRLELMRSGRRATKLSTGSDWRGGRAGTITSAEFRGPASGAAGGWGGDLPGAKDQSAAPEVNTGQFAKRARSRAAGMKAKPAVPGHGTGRFIQ